MKQYVIREVRKDIFEVVVFENASHPNAVYEVDRNRQNYFACTCPGYRWQRDKTQHKHVLLVKFWIENLDKEPGFLMWFDGEDIEYAQMFTSWGNLLNECAA